MLLLSLFEIVFVNLFILAPQSTEFSGSCQVVIVGVGVAKRILFSIDCSSLFSLDHPSRLVHFFDYLYLLLHLNSRVSKRKSWRWFHRFSLTRLEQRLLVFLYVSFRSHFFDIDDLRPFFCLFSTRLIIFTLLSLLLRHFFEVDRVACLFAST